MLAVILILTLLMAFIILDIAAWRWGYDSSEAFDSNEWERRHAWRN
jgi:hypothetical protein